MPNSGASTTPPPSSIGKWWRGAKVCCRRLAKVRRSVLNRIFQLTRDIFPLGSLDFAGLSPLHSYSRKYKEAVTARGMLQASIVSRQTAHSQGSNFPLGVIISDVPLSFAFLSYPALEANLPSPRVPHAQTVSPPLPPGRVRPAGAQRGRVQERPLGLQPLREGLPRPHLSGHAHGQQA